MKARQSVKRTRQTQLRVLLDTEGKADFWEKTVHDVVDASIAIVLFSMAVVLSSRARTVDGWICIPAGFLPFAASRYD